MTRVLNRLSLTVNASLLFLKIFGSLFGWPSLSASIYSSMSSWLIMVKLCSIQQHTMIETIFLDVCTVISLSRLKRPLKPKWSLNHLSSRWNHLIESFLNLMNLLAPKNSPFSAFSDKEEFLNTLPPCWEFLEFAIFRSDNKMRAHRADITRGTRRVDK